ncbi:MAG TPA: hypothetical protein VE547_13980, partial [Mycobacteriales bacterium]|nr:hypothetical protein [Mycobacteriales bacterium]
DRGKPGLAREWAQAVLPHATAGRPAVELLLRGHLETLHDALLADQPDRAVAAGVGTALVVLAPDRPEVIERTLTLLADRLLADLGLDEVTFAGPLHALLGALAAGYTRALLETAGRG